MQTSLEGPPYVEPATTEEAVMNAMITLGRRLRPRLPGDEIDFSSIPVLKLLHLDGPTRLTDLAVRLELDASTVSRHVRHLEDRGLVERTDDPDDGRASRIAVSERGVASLEDHAGRRRALIRAVLEDWDDPDLEQLRRLLARFHHDLATADWQHLCQAASTPLSLENQ